MASAASSRSYSASLECGNGQLDWGEVCDDGNTIDDDGCSNDCRLTIDVPCPNNRECVTGLCKEGRCAICETNDECAVGGCVSGVCIDVLANVQTVTAPRCGDGVLDDGEACDDGNALPGDGCSEICVDERSAATTVLPGSVVELPFIPGGVRTMTIGPTGITLPAGSEVPQTGPGLIAVAAAGAASGLAWIRRRRR